MHVKVRSVIAPLLAAATMAAVIGAVVVTPDTALAANGAANARGTTATTQAPAASISEEEAAGIVFMREEEKLARDVYLTLGDLWGLPIFDNIAASESTHMAAILGLMETYGLEDPVDVDNIGTFENAELQHLYDDLIAMGSQSVEAALEVGAIIEEVDIVDIEEYLAGTTAADIARVYENLLRGSRDHLRAFVSQLEDLGVDRDPYLLDIDTYEAIVGSDAERGGSSAETGSTDGNNGGGSEQGSGGAKRS
ncbi:MAG: DUF2202 domain-containing protein [Actinomycetota bacterium]|nr:DUF2202 domain-containing protein [Actinomycetota bacterium]